MVEGTGLEEADVVVEYGPGTGAFTGLILERLKPGALFFAIEKNPVMAREFKRRFPEVTIYNDSVGRVEAFCTELGAEAVDCIICGLPWASFTSRLQEELLGATCRVLRPGGRFATFAYLQGLLLPSGRAFKRRLYTYFSTVTTSRTVWRNLPPAFVYRCVK